MKVTAGVYKGRVLKVPKQIRPTQDIVKKALFNIMGDVRGISFLELFAGSGAVGFEALSRGARPVVFVDSRSDSISAIQANIRSFAAEGHCLVMHQDAVRAVSFLSRSGKSFDIVFFDPPYHGDEAKNVLKTLEACDIVARAGFVVIQHSKKEVLPEETANLKVVKQSRYGETVLSVYQKI